MTSNKDRCVIGPDSRATHAPEDISNLKNRQGLLDSVYFPAITYLGANNMTNTTAKLTQYIESHGLTVAKASDKHLWVTVSFIDIDGVLSAVTEQVPTAYDDVRDYLGY